MRAVATRFAVLLAGAMVVALALWSNVRFAGVGVAAGLPGSSSGAVPSPALVAVGSSGPSAAPQPSVVPSPRPLPTQTVSPVATLPPTPAPTAPPPPKSEADDCPPPPAGVRAAPILAHGDQRTKVVALTFDDGWDAANTRRILGILKRYHVNATFFPVGRAIQQSPEVWREVVAAGFPIGDHTNTHPYLSDLCYSAQLAELRRQAEVVRSKLGIQVQPYMRPPYDAWNRTTRIATTAAGQRAMVIWNIDTRDWQGETVSTITRRALHGQEGAIVLMHTNVHETAAALPAIIEGYRARGFRFVTIGQMLGIEGPVPYR